MSDDMELPILPPDSGLRAPLPSTMSFRKRSRGSSPGYSSDVPMFSSDDLADASLDNYVSPRRKKQYRRPWWDESVTRADLLKSQARRDLDSGVFMASDSSNPDDGFAVEPLPLPGVQRLENKFAATVLQQAPAPLQNDALAQRIIADCLENCLETVDLSGNQLTELSNETILPLHQLIRRPRFSVRPESDEAYHSLTAALQVVLSNNSLERAPGAIFGLENLKVLTLRNNQITQLPDNVSKLRNLVELNVAGNRLRWLPWELLGLVNSLLLDQARPEEPPCNGILSNGKLINLHILPNSFIRPCDPKRSSYTWTFAETIEEIPSEDTVWDEAFERSLDLEWYSKIQRELAVRMRRIGWKNLKYTKYALSSDRTMKYDAHVVWKKDPIYLGSTKVTLFNLDGTLVRNSPPAPSNAEEDAIIPPAPAGYELVLPSDTDCSSMSRVPSLFEVALLSCSDYTPLLAMEDFLSYDAPITIRRALGVAQQVAGDGGRNCSVCRRRYIQARAEWIEYWHCAPDSLQCTTDEVFLPFLRRTCSWVCAMDAFRENRAK